VRDFPQQRLCEFNRSHSDVEVISAFRLIPAAFMQENGELAPCAENPPPRHPAAQPTDNRLNVRIITCRVSLDHLETYLFQIRER
jgi:hypothetical protein